MQPVLGTKRSIIHLYSEDVLNESVTVVTLLFLQCVLNSSEKMLLKRRGSSEKMQNNIEVRQKKCIIGNEWGRIDEGGNIDGLWIQSDD